jgi:fibronectin-binding autotransporter adhesin
MIGAHSVSLTSCRVLLRRVPTRHNHLRRGLIISSATLALEIGHAGLQGATFTWDAGGAGNTNWSTGANWTGSPDNTAPGTGTLSGSDVRFASGGSTATVDSARTVGTVIFNSASAFTINGSSALTINGDVAVETAATYTISAPIVLGATGTWSVTTNVTLASSGIVSGANGFMKSGAGTLLLSGSNTYTGVTSIIGGSVVIDSIQPIGTASPLGAAGNEGAPLASSPKLFLNNGGTLRYTGGGHTTNRTFGIGTLGGTIDASGTGALVFNRWQTVGSFGTSGSRTLTLTGTSTFNNTLGLVLFDGGGTVGLGSGFWTLVKSGTGKWVIPAGGVEEQPPGVGFVNQYGGPTKILGGTLVVEGDLTGGVRQSGMANGGQNSGIGFSSNVASNLEINNGTLEYDYVGNRDPANPDPDQDEEWRAHDAGQVDRRFTVGVGGATLNTSGVGPLNLFAAGTLSMPGNGNRTLTLTGTFADIYLEGQNQYSALRAVIDDPDDGGITTVVKDGPGEWVLNGTNMYSGDTIINAGTLLLAHADNASGTSTFNNVLPSSTDVYVASGAVLELYTGDSGYNREGVTHPKEELSQTIASLTGSGTVDLNGGTLTVDYSGASSISFAGRVMENSDGDPFITDQVKQIGGHFVKDGTGMLVSSGNLTYTGETMVNDGTLVVQKLANATLTVNGGVAQVSVKATPNMSSGTSVLPALTIATSGATLDLTNNSTVVDYTGAGGNPTLVDAVRQHLQSGRVITSRAGTPTGTVLGYGDNAILGKASFGGISVDSSSVLIKFTYGADANLDGQVDVTDLGALATGWQTTAPWTSGDFDYTNFVDITDLGILGTNWQFGVGAPLFGEPMTLLDGLSLYPPLLEAALQDDYIRKLIENAVDNSYLPSLGDVPEPVGTAAMLSLFGESVLALRRPKRGERPCAARESRTI